MPTASPHQVTRLLASYRDGDRQALDRLIPLVYNELQALARRQRRHRNPGYTINTTALVHEAFFKLAGVDHPDWQNRLHFFRVAAQAMRQVLVDYARSRKAAKRGGDSPHQSLEALSEWGDGLPLTDERAEEVLALDEALTRLAAFDARQSQIVELRYFTGLTIEEAAEALALSPATVKREWAAARAWLYREMRPTG